jgi:hypothetical protein
MIPHAKFRAKLCLAIVALVAGSALRAEAGGLFRRRERGVYATARVVSPPPGPAPFPTTLGTFYPNPQMVVRGNFPAGGGYSPNDQFGDTSMDIYGPLSALRSTSAPVLTYARGYDGRPVVLPGTSFSTPNLPGNSPVVYPTQATYYYAPRESKNPPWWPKATNWIDQN